MTAASSRHDAPPHRIVSALGPGGEVATSFASLQRQAIPEKPGVYSVWLGTHLIYVGIAVKSLRSRLVSHASGRRGGDQFNIYVSDRFVLPTLGSIEIREVSEGALSLDALTREFIRHELAFRFVVTATGGEARTAERIIRTRGLADSGPPLLNPIADT